MPGYNAGFPYEVLADDSLSPHSEAATAGKDAAGPNIIVQSLHGSYMVFPPCRYNFL